MLIEKFKYCEIKIYNDCFAIGMQMSGGADSTLAAYLYAYTIKKYNLPIKLKRMTFSFGNKPDYFATAGHIQHKITELLNFDPWLDPYEIYYNHKDDHSVTNHIKLLYDNSIVNYFVNGRTKNPSINDVDDFNNSRIKERDDPEPLQYKEIIEPFYNIQKDTLIKQYLDLDIFNSLFKITNSCDANITENNFPCGQCWWCRERQWALEKVFKNEEYTSQK